MSRLHRQPAWERRLIAFAETVVGLPYVWGHTDCATMALRALATMTRRRDEDLVQRLGLPGWYDSRTSALRTFSALGGIRSALVGRLHCTEHPVRYAQHGDIFVLPGHEGHAVEAAVVVVSGRLLVSTETTGVVWRALEPVPDGAIALRL